MTTAEDPIRPYPGHPVLIPQLWPDGSGREVVRVSSPVEGMQAQAIVLKGG